MNTQPALTDPSPAPNPRVAPRPTGKPSCMDAEDYARWRVLNRRSAAQAVASPCADCTDPYRHEMAAVGRCEFVVACRAYTAHQLQHRRAGPGWRCPVCQPEPSQVPS